MARGGFPGGFGGGNMNNLMKQAQKLQKEMEEMQKNLENSEYEASVGGGAVVVKVSGKKEITSIKIKEENLMMPKFQILIYPVLDDKMNTNSMKEFWNTPMWNGRLNKQMWEYYLADVPYKSPFENVVNVPTYVEVTEYDCLRDEGINYYNLLCENNIQAFLNETKGTMHGYDILYKTQIAKENIKKRIDFISSIFK